MEYEWEETEETKVFPIDMSDDAYLKELDEFLQNLEEIEIKKPSQ